mgnify:CR=1 FL=1
MMYNPQLDTFLCVVEAGSFSKAAEQLYISAPAVIKQINSLETSLGMKLFDRTHRGLVVTEADSRSTMTQNILSGIARSRCSGRKRQCGYRTM